jgi:hypothetical protein
MTQFRNRAAVYGVLLVASAAFCQATATAQTTEYHQPLHERLPPGFTADTLARVRQYDPMWLQPVRVELPSGGIVSVYSATPEPLASLAAPAQFSVTAGHHYRLRISELPEFPGVEIFPSIEILDRLHPPHGTSANYPIPIVLTEADLREAVEGAMVTRVIYLENPRIAASIDPLRQEFPQTAAPTQNALQEADQMGRAMIIVRIGGRIPSGPNMPLSYFGSGGAFDPGESIPVNAGVVTLSDKPKIKRVLASRGR